MSDTIRVRIEVMADRELRSAIAWLSDGREGGWTERLATRREVRDWWWNFGNQGLDDLMNDYNEYLLAGPWERVTA